MEIADLYKISIESKSYNIGTALNRDYLGPLIKLLATVKTIKILTGIRRAGKSYLFKQLAKIAEERVPEKNILFLSFEHDDLVSKDLVNLAGIREMYDLFIRHADPTHDKYLFLDEIQNVEGWESFVRTIYDSEAANILITGSNSKLLSSELASALGGRTLEFFIQPFSFTEVLQQNQISTGDTYQIAKNQNEINRLFDQYLAYGGFPEALALPVEMRVQYKKSLVEKIILNDILPRFKGTQPRVFALLAEYFERTSSTIWSAENITKLTGISTSSVYQYVEILASSYLYTELPKYSFKAKAIFERQAKITCLDPLLAYNSDVSQRLEVVIYAELVRRYGLGKVYFGRDERAREVDFFVLVGPHSSKIAIQVAFELNAKNIKRELGPLTLAREYESADKFIIIAQRVKDIDLKMLPEWLEVMTPVEYLLTKG